MRTELINFEDLSDSRELMMKKTPPVITIFILTITSMMVIALIWASFGHIDTYVVASGEIRPTSDMVTLTLQSSGTISKIGFLDGDTVSKGDTIIECSGDYYIEQKDLINKQFEENKQKKEKYEKLQKSIENDKNLFLDAEDTIYYKQYKNYELELKSALEQLEDGNSQTDFSKKEIEKVIEQNKQDLKEATELYNEYVKLYNNIVSDESYTGNNINIKNIYKNYSTTLNKAQTIYNSSKATYNSIWSQYSKDTTSVDEIQVNQAYYSMCSAKADVDAVKTNLLLEISNKLENLKQQQTLSYANIESYNLKLEALDYDNTLEDVKEKIKNSYLININSTIENLMQENDNLSSNLADIEETISKLSIKASSDGILVYSQDYSVGDMVNAGTTVASIIPSASEYNVVLYIPEYNIAEIKVGQKVEYIFSSISATDFGKIYGEITSISADSFINQTSGQKYYKAIGTIEKTTLVNQKGETKELKIGMLAEVHSITGTQSILSWILDKLNFT